MNYYLNCCSLSQNGECDCESCIYYGGMDHGVVRCKADDSEPKASGKSAFTVKAKGKNSKIRK